MAVRVPVRGNVVVVVLVAIVITGCGGGGISLPTVGKTTAVGGTASPGVSPSGSTTVSGKLYDLPDPCALLTRADAEAALAEPVQEAFSSSPGASPFGVLIAECNYDAASGAPAINTANIGVTVRRYSATNGARTDFGTMDRGTPGTERKVSGLGDDAFVAGSDPPNPTSARPRGGAVLVANLTLEFSIALVKGTDPGGALTAAMRKAVDRLPTAPALAVSTGTVAGAAVQPSATRAVTPTQTVVPSPATVRPSTPAAGVAATGVTGQTVGGAAAAGDACALLTKAEIMVVLGDAVKDPELASVPPIPVSPGVTLTPSACTYDAVTSPSHVHLTVYRSAGGSAADLQQFKAIICGKKEPVPGLGDLACWYSAEHRELQVFQRGVFIDIEMLKLGKDVTEDVKTLARQALQRLP